MMPLCLQEMSIVDSAVPYAKGKETHLDNMFWCGFYFFELKCDNFWIVRLKQF
jgi:hypothetical protein